MALESIALIPSGYKANKLYCQLPVDGGADLTTSRASSATRVNKNGLIEDVVTGIPRLDYTNGGCPELLLEPQSTNLVTYSEDFTDASWTKSNITINANSLLSPDGSVNADSIVDDATNSFHRLQQSFTVVSGTTYSQSVYVKKGINRYFYLGTNNFSFWDFTFFDLESLVAVSTPTGVDTSIESLSNGWIRVSATKQANASGSFNFCFGTSDNTTTTYTGTGVSVVDVWGAQLEALSYSTSYIRTSGTTATRIADAVTGATGLGSVIGSSEGVLYFEGSALANDGLTRSIGLNDGTSNVGATIRFRPTANEIQFLLKDGVNPDVGNTLILSDATQDSKFALKWKNQDIAFWVNGVEELTSVSTMNISGLTDLDFNTFGSFYGRVKELKVYDTALTDAQLQTLTTL